MVSFLGHRSLSLSSSSLTLLGSCFFRLVLLACVVLVANPNALASAADISVTSFADLNVGGGKQGILPKLDNATELARMLAGPGLTIIEAKIIAGRAEQFGTFTDGTDSIKIDKGIILSTGNVNNVKGPNKGDSTTSQYNGPGYGPLSAFVTAGTALVDAAVLAIRFKCNDPVPNSEFKFDFVFGSEEYPEYVFEDYNDVFAFFLNGNKTSNNIALLPDGSAVGINTVNCGKNNNGVNQKNCDLFVNNVRPNPKFNIELDGFTLPLQVHGRNLSAENNIITLAIADAGDAQFDSAVFVQSGSLRCKSADAPTVEPSQASSAEPTRGPTKAPNQEPTTKVPTKVPVKGPTAAPVKGSTSKPSVKPTRKPTLSPASSPGKVPTRRPLLTKKPVGPTRRPLLTKSPVGPTNAPATPSANAPTNPPTLPPCLKASQVCSRTNTNQKCCKALVCRSEKLRKFKCLACLPRLQRCTFAYECCSKKCKKNKILKIKLCG